MPSKVKPSLRQQITEFVLRDHGVLAPAIASHVLAEAAQDVGFELPGVFVQWLLFANGCTVTHGGLFGLKSPRPLRDLLPELSFHSHWRSKRLLPVAWDGFGNVYTLDASSTVGGAVCFFELASSANEPDHRAAESFEGFLAHFFTEEARNGIA